jgi:FkbM family methyltransferase
MSWSESCNAGAISSALLMTRPQNSEGGAMIPFQLHRRIPLIRRPFWQRDRAIAERDEALAALSGMANVLEATRKERDGLRAEIAGLPFDHDQPFRLPPEFQTVSIAGHQGKQFQVVVDATNPSSYEQWIIDSTYYSDIARLLVTLLGGSGTLIDLGANIGTVSLPVGTTGSRVIALEMLPGNAMKLTLAVAVNHLPHFRVIQAAVTDHDGYIGYVGDAAWAQVSTAKTALQAVGMCLDTIIDIVELDSPWFLQSPVVMKIDVEGHELAALLGGERFLARHRPPVVFESIQLAYEAQGKARAVKDIFAGLNYSLHVIRGNILAPHQPSDQQISPVSDILAIPNERQDAIRALLSGCPMRPLSPREQVDWLKEVAQAEAGGYHRHIAALIPTIRNQIPEVAAELDLILGSLERVG